MTERESKFTPRRGPGGPGMGHGPGEKAKDFKEAMKRLFGELKNFRLYIVIALVLATLGATLSITAPNKLSKLTDTISEGLVLNIENMEQISTNITENLQKNMTILMENNELLSQGKLDDILDNNDSTKFMTVIMENEQLQNMLLEDFEVDGEIISVEDQVKFIGVMNSIDIENAETSEIYKKIDELPENIQDVIKPKMNIEKVKSIAIVLAGLYITSAVFTFIQGLLMTDVANKFAQELRSSISVKINRLPLRYFDLHTTGDILSRVTNDIDTIAQSMNQSLGTLVTSATLFLGSIIMMFYTNWIMAITAIVSSLIGFVFMFAILGRSQKYFVARQEELGNLNGHIEEIYSGLNIVKVYNGKKQSDEKFDEFNKRVYEANRKSQFLSGLMQPIMGFIGNFGYVAVCIVGALLTMNNMISFGVIVAFITYVRLFTNPLSQMAQAMTSLQTTGAASERVFEFLDENEMEKQDNIKKKISINEAKGKIEFEHIVFQYDNNDKPTIKDFSAVAQPGQKIAIVGPTGAGKTTLVNLLMKFYNLDSGNIIIDGIPTDELTRENIHELFTMVLQDTWLFEGTIRENIIYNAKDITDEQVMEVCKTVGLDHFIKTLPKGLDTELSENDSVSAGQRQLLTIARGMLKNTPFLILDEATSNVDTRTEELVQAAMDKLTEGKTSFIIAHRLSTIKNADLILVIGNGNIVEQGNHEELMKKNGVYAELYNSQFEI
jgi:ATP-binding cassette subfamily B protein